MNEKNVKWDKVFYGKSWINHVVDTIRTKDILQSFYFKRYLLRAIMAGFILGVITVFVLLIKASLDTHVPTGVINLVAAVAFSFALVLILFTNSELLTSNFMYFYCWFILSRYQSNSCFKNLHALLHWECLRWPSFLSYIKRL